MNLKRKLNPNLTRLTLVSIPNRDFMNLKHKLGLPIVSPKSFNP